MKAASFYVMLDHDTTIGVCDTIEEARRLRDAAIDGPFLASCGIMDGPDGDFLPEEDRDNFSR